MPELNARALLGATHASSCGRDGRDLDVDAVGAEDPGGVSEGGLGEREQRVGGELPAVFQQDGVDDLSRLEVGREGTPAGQGGDRGDEAFPDRGRPGDQALGGDETLGEQVAQRGGSPGALDVDELVARAEQVADLQAAACSQRVANRCIPVQAQVSLPPDRGV